MSAYIERVAVGRWAIVADTLSIWRRRGGAGVPEGMGCGSAARSCPRPTNTAATTTSTVPRRAAAARAAAARAAAERAAGGGGEEGLPDGGA